MRLFVRNTIPFFSLAPSRLVVTRIVLNRSLWRHVSRHAIVTFLLPTLSSYLIQASGVNIITPSHLNNGNSRSFMKITRLTVLTVHFPFWITGTGHSLSFSAMFLIRWAATTTPRLGIKSLARGLSGAGWFGGASHTSQDSSIGDKYRMARSKYDLPTLSLDPRTTPSLSSTSFTRISILHFPRLRPSLWIKTTSQTLSVYSLVLFFRLSLPQAPYVFGGPTWSQNVFAPTKTS